MSPSRAFLALLAVFAAAGGSSADDGLRPGESVREADDVYPCSPFQELWAVRIVDAWTGRPIPGATVHVPNHVPDGATPEDISDLCAAQAEAKG